LSSLGLNHGLRPKDPGPLHASSLGRVLGLLQGSQGARGQGHAKKGHTGGAREWQVQGHSMLEARSVQHQACGRTARYCTLLRHAVLSTRAGGA